MVAETWCRLRQVVVVGRGHKRRHNRVAGEFFRSRPSLTPREEKILRMRFGFEGDNTHTLEEIGDSLALTRERIRQVESRALRSLRASSHVGQLRIYLSNN